MCELHRFFIAVAGTVVNNDGKGGSDVAGWPYSVSLLVKLSAFLGTLHWPCSVDDLGLGGPTFLETLFLYENWTGEMRGIELAHPKNRNRRLIGITLVPKGPGAQIWRS